MNWGVGLEPVIPRQTAEVAHEGHKYTVNYTVNIFDRSPTAAGRLCLQGEPLRRVALAASSMREA